jgi:hypothetical protein
MGGRVGDSEAAVAHESGAADSARPNAVAAVERCIAAIDDHSTRSLVGAFCGATAPVLRQTLRRVQLPVMPKEFRYLAFCSLR